MFVCLFRFSVCFDQFNWPSRVLFYFYFELEFIIIFILKFILNSSCPFLNVYRLLLLLVVVIWPNIIKKPTYYQSFFIDWKHRIFSWTLNEIASVLFSPNEWTIWHFFLYLNIVVLVLVVIYQIKCLSNVHVSVFGVFCFLQSLSGHHQHHHLFILTINRL